MGIRSVRTRTVERVIAAVAACLLVIQLAVVTSRVEPDGRPDSVAIEEVDPTPPPSEPPSSPSPQPTPSPSETVAVAEPAPAEPQTEADQVAVRELDPGEAGTDEEPAARQAPPPPPPPAEAAASGDAAPPPDPARQRFARDFPAQASASQEPGDPATARWAVLIGINDHHGRTRDNVGSRQDAEELHEHLVRLGWRDDHIVLLTDLAATRERIEQAIAWLARKTDRDSVAVFHYSGHTKQWHGWDADGDGEVPDEALWPADNAHMTDRELTDRLAHVAAGRMWINIGACEAAGYADPGMLQDGRLLTFSSRESEKSYEDPSVSNSVWGYYLLDRAIRAGHADADGDGDVTVQEAFEFAAPRSSQRTANGRNGPQHPVMQDRSGAFSLRIPAPPPPPADEPPPEDDDGDGDGDGGGDDEDGDNGCGLPICPRVWAGGSLSR